MLTDAQLARIMPAADAARRARWLGALNVALREAECSTPRRAAALLATVAVESGQLQWSEEIWGPTAAQRRYEGRRDLGNTEVGDGYRYRGRGLVQLTGRSNYRRAGSALGLPLEAEPDRAAQPATAGRVLAWYWRTRRCNEPADRGDIAGVTRIVNGGSNGLPERRRFYARALAALGDAWRLDEPAPAAAPSVVLPDGQRVPCERHDGALWCPLRAVAEAAGLSVTWDAATATATLRRG